MTRTRSWTEVLRRDDYRNHIPNHNPDTVTLYSWANIVARSHIHGPEPWHIPLERDGVVP